MMKKRLVLVGLFLFFLMPTFAAAQLKQDTRTDVASALVRPDGIQGIVGLLGLDPNRFSMNHSYSLSFGSFGGQSISQGLYLNTMKYQFSDPLKMYVQIGFQHQPLGSLGRNSLSQNQIFLSGAGVEYKPSDKFRLQFEFGQQPNSRYSPYRRYGYRHSFFEEREENK